MKWFILFGSQAKRFGHGSKYIGLIADCGMRIDKQEMIPIYIPDPVFLFSIYLTPTRTSRNWRMTDDELWYRFALSIILQSSV